MGEMSSPTSSDYNRDRIQSQEARISELERKVYELVSHCDEYHGSHNCCSREKKCEHGYPQTVKCSRCGE